MEEDKIIFTYDITVEDQSILNSMVGISKYKVKKNHKELMLFALVGLM